MTELKPLLLERANVLNASAAWGSDQDAQYMLAAHSRIETLEAMLSAQDENCGGLLERNATLLALVGELVGALGELIAHRDRPPNHAHPDGALGEIEMWRQARATLTRAKETIDG